MGDYQAFENGEFKNKITMSAGENIQIRDLALEAIRQSLNKDMTKLIQKNFFLRINVYRKS